MRQGKQYLENNVSTLTYYAPGRNIPRVTNLTMANLLISHKVCGKVVKK